MSELEDKTNNEILFEIKQMEAEHEAIKLKIFNYLDKLDELDRRFDQANKIIVKRLKGNL